MQVRQQCPDPEQRDRNLSGQPLVTMGGGALPLPLPMPAQPATLTATRVATKATSTFFIGVPLSFTPCDSHFVPRCTVSRPLNPMVHRLRRQWGTSKGTVALGTQLPSRPVAMCLWAGGWHVDGKQLAAVCRIKALWRLHCCGLPVLCWGRAGASGGQNFYPRPLRPGFFLSCGKLAWRHYGKRSASTPCLARK